MMRERPEDKPLPLTEHLAELRARLWRSLAVVGLLFFVAYTFHDQLFMVAAWPVLKGLRAHGIYTLQALQVTETVFVYIEVSLAAAVLGSAPYVLYQIWAFVAPGLYPHERRFVLPVVGLTSLFFVLGLVFCYFVFVPLVVDFLVGFTQGSGVVALKPTVKATFSLVLMFLVVFGLVFQLPLLMFFFSLLGVVRPAVFLRYARYFVVLAFVLGAVFTPPDIMSQVLLAVPLVLLYVVGIGLAWVGGALRRRESGGTWRKALAALMIVAFGAAVVTPVVLVGSHSDRRVPVLKGSPAFLVLDLRSRMGLAVARFLEGGLTGKVPRKGIAVLSVPKDDSGAIWLTRNSDCFGRETVPGVCVSARGSLASKALSVNFMRPTAPVWMQVHGNPPGPVEILLKAKEVGEGLAVLQLVVRLSGEGEHSLEQLFSIHEERRAGLRGAQTIHANSLLSALRLVARDGQVVRRRDGSWAIDSVCSIYRAARLVARLTEAFIGRRNHDTAETRSSAEPR